MFPLSFKLNEDLMRSWAAAWLKVHPVGTLVKKSIDGVQVGEAEMVKKRWRSVRGWLVILTLSSILSTDWTVLLQSCNLSYLISSDIHWDSGVGTPFKACPCMTFKSATRPHYISIEWKWSPKDLQMDENPFWWCHYDMIILILHMTSNIQD